MCSVCLCMCAHRDAGAHGGQKRMSEPPELELRDQPTWVLWFKPPLQKHHMLLIAEPILLLCPFSLGVSVYVHVCQQVMYKCVHMCLWPRVTRSWCRVPSSILTSWGKVSLWTWSLLIWLDLLANKPQEFFCLCCPSAEVADSHYTQLYVGAEEPNPCLHTCVESSLQTEAFPSPFDSFLASILVSKNFSNPTGIRFLELFEILVLCCFHPNWGTKKGMNMNETCTWTESVLHCGGESESSSWKRCGRPLKNTHLYWCLMITSLVSADL